MTKRTLQRHDQFFQRLLEKPGAAGTLLRERLPPEVVSLLVDEPPELVPGTFVSQRLRACRTDRLYKTKTITGRPVLIYTLLEHKSAPDPRTPMQLLGYQVQALENWDRTEGTGPDGKLRPLPAIVTMVVYHGSDAWSVPLSLAETTDVDEALRPYILDFRYSLVDLGRIPDARLSREKILRVGLLILKHGSLKRANKKKLLNIAREALRLGQDDLVTLVYYLLGDLDGPKAEIIRAILDELVPDDKERVMSLAAEQWKAEGFNLGLTQGVTRGKAEGKAEGKADTLLFLAGHKFGEIPPDVVARVRGASVAELDEWTRRFLGARTLVEVFGPVQPH